MFPRENDWLDELASASASYGVPVWVLKATIGKESSFDPGAYHLDTGGTESRGLMQVIAPTARALGYAGPLGDDATRSGGLYEPALSIRLGAKLLGQLRARYPSEPWDAIYAAFNAGAIRRDASGVLRNESNVKGWRRLADYYAPGWDASSVPDVVGPPAPSSAADEPVGPPAPSSAAGVDLPGWVVLLLLGALAVALLKKG